MRSLNNVYWRLSIRRYALNTVSAIALAASTLISSHAAAAAVAKASESETQEIVVTGSRIVREGYEAATPLAVVGTEEIENQAAGNVAAYLATLTVFNANQLPNAGNSQGSVSSGTSGVSSLNIRGLGANRSLTLLDGQRSVGSLLTGAVDISNFPQQLISRVETVTGGASAVYGSDAVGGVTNFILDKTYTGVKGDLSAGVTSYGDGKNYRIDLSTGFGFGNDRGHVLLSGSNYMKDEIRTTTNRDWDLNGWCIMTNPAYNANTNSSVPQRFTTDHCGESNASPGGIIVSGPLKGTAFGPGGVPYAFTYGDLVADPLMRGGDWKSVLVPPTRGSSLDPGEHRQNFYSRFSYDISDSINVAYSWSWARQQTFDSAFTQFQEGNAGTILIDNAFIPAEVRARGIAQGVTSFRIGSMNFDLPTVEVPSERFVLRHVLSASGKFDMIGSSWSWDAYLQHGKARNIVVAHNVASRSRFTKAIDAVRDVNGRIVCRVNANASTADDDPACVPWNEMGIGVNTEAGLNYLVGDSILHQNNVQKVASASITGEPFSIWAGPVSVAVSLEHRQEKTYGVSDATSRATDWFAGNYKPIIGQFNVTEGALETLIPLASGKPWADSWDLSAAARFTGYSTSGFVVTWKAGSTYSPVPDIKFRGGLSRDIRAPNLQELYAAGTSSQGNQFDPFTNTNPLVRGLGVGNPNLGPEKADNIGFGAVLQPRVLPGFSASVDYWRVRIKDAIAGSGSALNLCFNGNQTACGLITRGGAATLPGVGPFAGQLLAPVLETRTTSINISSSTDAGIDVATTYRMRLGDFTESWNGNVTLRGDAVIGIKGYSFTGQPGAVPFNAPQNWRANTSISYDNEPFLMSLTARITPKPKVGQGLAFTVIECASGCPVSRPDRITYNYHKREGTVFLDGAVSYKFLVGDATTEAYLNVKNILNRDPAILTVTSLFYYRHNGEGDNALGRIFRAGLRFQF